MRRKILSSLIIIFLLLTGCWDDTNTVVTNQELNISTEQNNTNTTEDINDTTIDRENPIITLNGKVSLTIEKLRNK